MFVEPRHPADLEAFVPAVSTPGSPQYRHYLPPASSGHLRTHGSTLSGVRSWLSAPACGWGTSTNGLLIR